MNKEQAKIILSVQEAISGMFIGYTQAKEHFDNICNQVLCEWIKPGAYFPNYYLGESTEYSFNCPAGVYGRVDFQGRTIRVKTEGKEYMIDIDAARKAGLATEIQS